MIQDATLGAMRGWGRHVGLAFAALTFSAGTLACGLATGAQAAVTGPATYVRVMPTSVKHDIANHWIASGSLSFAQGTVSEQVGMQCPNGLIAADGAFALNPVGQNTDVDLSFNGPRIDESPPDYTSWGWHFFFPGGAPAGVTGLFTIYCEK